MQAKFNLLIKSLFDNVFQNLWICLNYWYTNSTKVKLGLYEAWVILQGPLSQGDGSIVCPAAYAALQDARTVPLAPLYLLTFTW